MGAAQCEHERDTPLKPSTTRDPSMSRANAGTWKQLIRENREPCKKEVERTGRKLEIVSRTKRIQFHKDNLRHLSRFPSFICYQEDSLFYLLMTHPFLLFFYHTLLSPLHAAT